MNRNTRARAVIEPSLAALTGFVRNRGLSREGSWIMRHLDQIRRGLMILSEPDHVPEAKGQTAPKVPRKPPELPDPNKPYQCDAWKARKEGSRRYGGGAS